MLPAAADVVITIDKSAQRMTVAVDGAKRWTWPVSTGARGYDTPSGSYTAFRMEKDYSSKEWDDAPMPYSIFFTKRGHAIHGSYNTKRLGETSSAWLCAAAPGQRRQALCFSRKQGYCYGESRRNRLGSLKRFNDHAAILLGATVFG